jgi:signal transduction histidine kinase
MKTRHRITSEMSTAPNAYDIDDEARFSGVRHVRRVPRSGTWRHHFVGESRSGARPSTIAYRGPDRRGVIRRLDRPVNLRSGAAMIVGAVAVPIAGAAIARTFHTGSGPWLTGVADAAFVGFSIAAALLLFRWRLVGDAACVPLSAAAAIVGLYFVLAAAHPDAMEAGLAATLRAVSVAIVVPLTLRVLFGPEVRGDLRPLRSVGGVLLVAVAVALPLGLSPARTAFDANPGGVRVVDVVAAFVSVVLAGMALLEGVRRRRLLLVGFAALLVSVGGASTAAAVGVSGPWQSVSALFLFVGAIEFLAVVGSELQPAINAVVIHDVRGRRRWEAAETQLTEAHSRIQVQRHDVSSMLSAIDGTLLVLTTQRDQLPAHDTDRLLAAVRDEVHVLQANLNGRSGEDLSYDLAELVANIVSVRDSGEERVRCELQPEIELRGRRDRVAVAVDNLLANAEIHAPTAQVTVRTRCVTSPGGTVAEIEVADNGPGLSEPELRRAFERGWRGVSARSRPGSGIGLGQCRDLIEAEGGTVDVYATNTHATPGHRGLTVRITLPVHTARDPVSPRATRSVQMRVLDGGAAI